MAFTEDINELVEMNPNGLLDAHTTWQRVPLSSIADVINGFAFKSKEFNTEGVGAPLVRIRDVLKGKSETYYSGEIPEGYWIDKGDIVVGMDGDFNINWWSSEKSLLNQRVCKVQLYSSLYDKRYLYRALPGYLEAINRYTSSVTVKHLSSKTMLSIPMPLPPLNEQTRIANKLDELLAQVDIIKARIDAIPSILKRFRQSVLAAAVSGKLTEEWRGENPLPVADKEQIEQGWISLYETEGKKYKAPKILPNTEDQEEAPNTWVKTQLGYVFDVYVGSTPSRKNEEFWGGRVPWVSSSEVAFCRINSTKEHITEDGFANTSTNMHPPGTVMLAMIGQGKTRGQPAILDIEACHNQNTAALRVLDEFCCSEYLYYFLWKQYEETRKVGAGNNQKALNKSSVQGLSFWLPPLEEQKQIVQKVEQLFAFADQIELRVKEAQARIDNLSQSILAKAFRGELVPQDPNDEPASELLARIQKEREEAAALANAAKKTARKPRTKKT